VSTVLTWEEGPLELGETSPFKSCLTVAARDPVLAVESEWELIRIAAKRRSAVGVEMLFSRQARRSVFRWCLEDPIDRSPLDRPHFLRKLQSGKAVVDLLDQWPALTGLILPGRMSQDGVLRGVPKTAESSATVACSISLGIPSLPH
jgi:hypothetical protein